MDLASFLTRSQKNGTINMIANGFENSQFSQDIPDCGIMVKDILDKLNKATSKRIEIPTVTGAISNNSLQSDPKKTTNSFSMEFNTICNNILAICGYELSYNLSILMSLKHIIQQYIDDIESAEDYESIILNLNIIRNIVSQPSFDVESFDSAFINAQEDDSLVFRFDSELKPVKDDFFENIIKHATTNQERKNISGLDLNKKLYVLQLNALLENTNVKTIEPENINELLMNIGNKIAYRGWFLKAWSMLYDEILVDMGSCDMTSNMHPLDVLFEKLKIGVHKNKYISQLLVYFEQVINETKSGMTEALKTDAINVELSKELLKYIAETMLSLYTQLAYALYNHQRYNTFNKSARVHYALMYYLILTCKPKLYEYDITQQSALRYLLLPKKAIDESLSLLKTKRNSPSRRIIEEEALNLDDSASDEENDTEEEEEPEPPKKSRGKKAVKTQEPAKPGRKPRTAKKPTEKPEKKTPVRKPRETKKAKK